MAWSVRLGYIRYLRANVLLTSPLVYVFFALASLGIGAYQSRGHSWLSTCLFMTAYLVLLVGVTPAMALLRLRGTFAMAGSQVVTYRLSDDALALAVGRDLVQVPSQALRVKRLRNGFAVLNRESAAPMLVFFDQPQIGQALATRLAGQPS